MTWKPPDLTTFPSQLERKATHFPPKVVQTFQHILRTVWCVNQAGGGRSQDTCCNRIPISGPSLLFRQVLDDPGLLPPAAPLSHPPFSFLKIHFYPHSRPKWLENVLNLLSFISRNFHFYPKCNYKHLSMKIMEKTVQGRLSWVFIQK